MRDEYEILPEEKQALDKVFAFAADNAEEIEQLNERLSELRYGLREVFSNNYIDEVFDAIDERTGGQAYDIKEFFEIDEIAQSLGMGFSYEGYYLWEPSTRSC